MTRQYVGVILAAAAVSAAACSKRPRTEGEIVLLAPTGDIASNAAIEIDRLRGDPDTPGEAMDLATPVRRATPR